ncbi:MAG TPA: hypothetical protein VGL72_23075 [Bryobacteraceae bacterium]|jgi:hypothetical protein
MSRSPYLSLTSILTAGLLWSQNIFVPVSAPHAQELIVATRSAHPELQKLGLHAIPPGQQEYAIIANAIPGKIGKLSSPGDLAVVHSGQPTVKKEEKGRFYDLCLPIADRAGHPIGITVMEIPFASATDAADALSKATVVRDELQRNIPSREALFADNAAPLVLTQTIPLPGLKTRFDHFAVDLKHNQLFATPEDYHAVTVYDTVTGNPVAEIRGVAKPHAVLYRQDLDRLYVTDGDDGALKIFDRGSRRQLASVPLEKDADSIGYEPARNYLYIVNGGKDVGKPFSLVSVIDTNAARKVAEIQVDGETLEAMTLDLWRPRLYLNNKAKNQVVVIDRWKNEVVAKWPVTMGTDNVAMALDEPHQRLFIGCRSGHIVVFDSNTGKELQSLGITKGVDDMEYDAPNKRLYAVGGGAIDVFEEKDADHYSMLGKVQAGAGAKTARLVPQINRYFVAVPQAGDHPASIQVFQPLHIAPMKPIAAPEAAPVRAPHALELEMSRLSAHPDLRKMGLHAVPPGGHDSVIIANANTTRIGIKSSEGDLAAVKDAKTYCVRREDGAFYNLKLPLQDAAGRTIGILVMEMPFTSAADEKHAIHKAEEIRRELAQQIPDYASLFR